MSMINYASREINCKIVYYGPGLCGKTTNLEYIFEKVAPNTRGGGVSHAVADDLARLLRAIPEFVERHREEVDSAESLADDIRRSSTYTCVAWSPVGASAFIQLTGLARMRKRAQTPALRALASLRKNPFSYAASRASTRR